MLLTPRQVEELLRDGERPVLRYLLAHLDVPADARELAQETLVRAFHALQRGEAPRRPVAWLLGIARNVLLETWRGERYRRQLEQRLGHMLGPSWAGSWDDLPGVDSASLHWQEHVESRLVVGEAVEELAPDLRAPVLLHYFAGLPLTEVAAHLGTTRGAVKMRLFRARLALRTHLEVKSELEDLVTDARRRTPIATAARAARGAAAEPRSRRPARTTRAAPATASAAEPPPAYGALTFAMEVGGLRYVTEPVSNPAFSGEVPALDDLKWAVDRLHAVRLAGPRPLSSELSFWAAPDPFEHPDPAGVWSLMRAARIGKPEFELIPTDGWRLGTDPDWRRLLERLQRAGLRHIWLTFAGLEDTHDALRGRPGSFAAAVSCLARAREVGLSRGANVIVSNRNTGELEQLVRLIYSYRDNPADARGASVYVPYWSPFSPAYEALRPEPDDLVGLPPPDAIVLWRHEFWNDPAVSTEGALTQSALRTAPGESARDGSGSAADWSAGFVVNARMDVLARRAAGPPFERLANLRDDPPEQVYETLASLEPPPLPPSDAELAARYGDPHSRKVHRDLASLRRRWTHAWRADHNLLWL